MMSSLLKNLLIFCFFSLLLSFPTSVRAATHPFLMVKESEYQILEQRKTQEPWKSMYDESLNRYTTFKNDYMVTTTDGSINMGPTVDRIRDVLSSATLLYIIDPVNRDIYKNKIVRVIKDLDTVYPNSALPPSTGSDHIRCVRVSTAYVNAILALDVIYNSVSTTDLPILTKIINDAVVYYRGNPIECNDWPQAERGLSGTSALFNENYTKAQSESVAYKNELFNEKLSDDGVYGAAITYGQARLGSSERTSKSGFMHVSEYTGFDHAYYSSYQLQRFTDWYNCAAYTPINTNVTFGDTYFDNSINIRFSTNTFMYGAGTLSSKAAKCAAWRIANGARAPVDFISYVFTKNPLPPAEVPKSDIWSDGMASFWDENSTTDTLMGALWNNTVNETHKHPDTNAIFISGYGEDLLANSGYMGAGGSCCGFTESYIRSDPESSNTVTTNNNGGTAFSEIGGKITSWLLSDKFDFARGKGIQNTISHFRDFYFIHAQDQAPGYFITNDFITGMTSGGIQMRFHPTSATYATIQPNTEYRWNIKRQKTTSTFLTIFLGNPPPNSVQVLDGLIGSQTEADSIVGKYIKVGYSFPTIANGIATVIFPHDSTHLKPTMTRISQSGITGVKLEHPTGEIDFVVDSINPETNFQSAQFKAKTAIFRLINNNLAFYHAREATKFIFQNVGFESIQPVTIHVRDNKGQISVSTVAQLSIYKPGITGVKVNGTPIAGTATPNVFTITQFPAGNSTIEIVTAGNSPAPTASPSACQKADINLSGQVDISDYSLLTANFFSSSPNPARADIDGDGNVDLTDYSILVANFFQTCPAN